MDLFPTPHRVPGSTSSPQHRDKKTSFPSGKHQLRHLRYHNRMSPDSNRTDPRCKTLHPPHRDTMEYTCILHNSHRWGRCSVDIHRSNHNTQMTFYSRTTPKAVCHLVGSCCSLFCRLASHRCLRTDHVRSNGCTGVCRNST